MAVQIERLFSMREKPAAMDGLASIGNHRFNFEEIASCKS